MGKFLGRRSAFVLLEGFCLLLDEGQEEEKEEGGEKMGDSGRRVIGATPGALSGGAKFMMVSGENLNKDPLMATGGTKTMRGKHYYNVTLTEPPLYFTPVGKRWSLDILAVANNSVRRELSDMYYIVQSMLKRRMDLNHDDIDDLYVWFEVFHFFVQGIFELQEQVNSITVYPKSDDKEMCLFAEFADRSFFSVHCASRSPGNFSPHRQESEAAVDIVARGKKRFSERNYL